MLNFFLNSSIFIVSSSVNSISPTFFSSPLNIANLNTISFLGCSVLSSLSLLPSEPSPPCELLLSPWGGFSTEGLSSWSGLPSFGILSCTVSLFPSDKFPVLDFNSPSVPCDDCSDSSGDWSCGGCSSDGGLFSVPLFIELFTFLLTSNIFDIGLYLSENKFSLPFSL